MTAQAKQREQGIGSQYRNTAPVPLSRPLSDDDGATWKGGLLLDERESSYPDGLQAEDGTLYIIYDHQRYTLNRAGKRGVGSVVMATFREADIRAARAVTDQVRLRVVITQLRKTKEVSEGELK
jgi:hypothetical protein